MTHCHQHRVRQWRSAARQYADRGSLRFSARRATVPTYACSLLLRSFPVIDRQIVYRLPARIFKNPCQMTLLAANRAGPKSLPLF